MIKNSPEIQSFLEKTAAQVKESDEKCNIITFSEFWDIKYGADNRDFDKRSFLNDVTVLLSSNQVSYYQELTSYKQGIAPVVKFFKRIIRKICAFLFLPVIAAQNAVNMSVARIMIHLRGYVNKEEIFKLQINKRDNEMKLMLKTQEEQIEKLSKEIELLNEKIAGLESGRNSN